MSKRGWVLFVAMCLIWGLPYLLIRIAVRDLSPADLVFARTGIAALLLVPIAARRGVLGGLRGHWKWVLTYTAVELTIPWLLLSRAEERLTSSLAGLLVAAVPLVGIGLTRLLGLAEEMTSRRWIGLLVGVAGVASLVGLQVGKVDMAAVGEIGVVAIGYALGPLILSHRLGQAPGLAVVAASLAVTAVVYAPFAIARPPHHLSGEIVWSVVGLAVICTAIAFVVFFWLIAEVGPTRATVITYVNPAVAIALGVAVLGEHVTAGMAVGFPLVLIGSYFATARKPGHPGTESIVVEDAVVSPG
ncbi:MAG TPA: EamA family transporter [Mycobacteriales bacterium]|nr:EamA family transporter [Mycobacteriales bacterium]